jgi:cysteine desulfurase
MIYLDYNATTPIDPAVADAMRPFIETHFGNPSSGHGVGKVAREAVAVARQSVARLINAEASEIIFTSGGTEAGNMAIKSVAELQASKGRRFLTTAVEHPATIEPMRWLEKRGYTFTAVGVDATGRVDPEEIRRGIRSDTILISVMHAQNEVGTLEPIAEIGEIAKSAGVLFHVDAAQSTGKAPVDVKAMQADFVSIAGHKVYAPKGIGALYVRSGVEVEPLIHGASQESGRRAGTENVIMAVGLGKAAELAAAHLNDPTIARLRDRLWAGLNKALGDRIVLNGHETLRLSGTLNVSFLGYVGGELLARVPEICASTGAACHSGDAKPSAVLTAMGIPRERAIGAVRFSVGRPTTEAEIDRAVAMIVKAANSDRPIH